MNKQSMWRWLFAALVFAQVLVLGCSVFDVRLPDAGFASRADAQARTIELSGSCSRGEVLVAGSSGRFHCEELQSLLPRCDDGELLSNRDGRLRCVGGDQSEWGVEGLLPHCSSGAILVSEGFGRWRCEDR